MIIAGIMDLLEKAYKQEKHHISGPQLNIIVSILDLLKIFSEVIVASKCGPLASLPKTFYVIKTGPSVKFL